MTADNPAARVDLDAAKTVMLSERDLDVLIEAAHPSRPDRNVLLLAVVERILADRLAPLLAERDEARAALEAGDACGAVGCRALAERDALRKRVDALVGTLRKQAGLEFDRHGPHDPRGAAFWDVAAWVEETALADPEAS